MSSSSSSPVRQIRKSVPGLNNRSPRPWKHLADHYSRRPYRQQPSSPHTPLLRVAVPGDLEPEEEPDSEMMELQAPVLEHSTPNGENGNANANTKMGTFQRLCMDYRLLEFVVAVGMMGIGGVFAVIPVYMRTIPSIEIERADASLFFARDPSIDQKMMKQHVPMPLLLGLAVGIPIVTNLIMNFVLPRCNRAIVVAHDTRDFLLSLALAAGISTMLTQFIKNMTGRFRPCFYNMCKWDLTTKWNGVADLCRDAAWEQESRKSFPSGHASMSWATLLLLTLYLMGRSRLAVENRNETFLRGGRKTLKLVLCFAPTLLACWISVTRSLDNWHHYSDILAGSCLGAMAAGIGYFYNYGSIFSWESAGIPFQEFHHQRKKREVRQRALTEKKMVSTDNSPLHHGSSRSGTSHSQHIGVSIDA